MAQVPAVTDATFDSEVVKSKVPVLVDFHATWCGPCKLLSPVIDEIAKAYVGKLKVVKVDVDEAQETAMQLGVTSVPTVVLFKGGREAMRQKGAVPKGTLTAQIDENL